MVKRSINGYQTLMFLTFFIIKTLLLYIRIKSLIFDVDVYHLHAHDIKFNVNSLTPNQITFCLADTKNVSFKIPIHVDSIK